MTTSQDNINANDQRRHANNYINANNVQLPDLGLKLTNSLSRTQRKNQNRRLKVALVRKIEGKMVDPTDEEMAKKRDCATAPPGLGRKAGGKVSFAQLQPAQLFPNDQGTTANTTRQTMGNCTIVSAFYCILRGLA
jgi:hypothetical protein